MIDVVKIINAVYALAMMVPFFLSAIIVFHILRYSYSKSAMYLMLIIFVPVVSVLIYANVMLFGKIPLSEIFSLI